MDKKSNRTDLLAAGRKKLEQYRQKNSKGKGSKGKHGKTSSNTSGGADNSEQHDDDIVVLNSANAPTESSHLLEKAPQLHPDSESLAQSNSEDSIDSAISLGDKSKDDQENSVGALEDNEPKNLSSISKEKEKLPVHSIDDERAALGISIEEVVNADSHPITTSCASGLCVDEDVFKKEDQEVSGSGLKDGERSIMLGQQEDADLSVPLVERSTSSGKSDTSRIGADAENDSVASGSVGQAVNLMKIVDMIKGLSEDDFAVLINSRSTVNSSALPVRTAHSDVCGMLREQLYVANIYKELYNLQLREASKHETDMDHKQKQLDVEVSLLTASLDDLNKRTEYLYAELTECRSELKTAICEKEELQRLQFSSDAQVMELSSKIDEMEITIEELSKSSFKCLDELDCCKHQLADSLAENERLVNSVMSINEEKNKEMELKEQLDEKHSMELAGCRSSIDALEVEITNLNVGLGFVTDEKMMVEEETLFLYAQNQKLSVDLVDCRCLINTLEEENYKLNANLDELREAIEMIKEMKESLAQENERLSHEVSAYQEKLSEEHAQFIQLENNLNQDKLHHEQIMEENVSLNSTLEIYKGKIAVISSRDSKLLSEVGFVGTQDWGCANTANADDLQNIPKRTCNEVLPSVASKPASDVSEEKLPISHPVGDIYGSFSGFEILQGHLEEAERLLQDLEKGMEGMHSHSMNLIHSFGRSAAPGISKLIQAFEAKPQSDGNESEATQIDGEDLYMSVKQYTGKLDLVLKAIYQDTVHASNFVTAEIGGHQSASSSLRELLVDVESWKDCCANVELHNIELEVQYEVMKQHMNSMEVRHIELETLCEASKRKESSLAAKNFQLAETLMHYDSRITELFDQFVEVQKSSGEIACNVHNDLDGLRQDMTEKICSVEGALESSFSMAAQVVKTLDAVVGSPVMSPNPASFSDRLGSDGQILASVNAACLMIEDLKERLEATSRENKTLTESYEEMRTNFDALIRDKMFAIDLLWKVFSDLKSCILDGSSGHDEESELQHEESRHYDVLDAGQFENIIMQLRSLLNERQQLKELNDNLHSELLSRRNDIEVLKTRSCDSDLLLKLVENINDVLKLTPAEMNSDEPSLLLLQSLISLLVVKYKDADDHARLLRDDLNSRMVELRELQECVESLNSFNFQQENEIFVLKESLKRAKDNYDATRDHLLLKATELEHCEQRVVSVREKLSIAVAKGKGLIVQRDSLKQSLSETSTELERCSQELQLKEDRLNEVEHKLKDYSEAAERMEALESELSYIRNSATALRESFLLKDSALQRIEEILEYLELPEHFHSRDTVDKVNYLANTLAANSLHDTDWEQRSSIGGGSISDAGIVKTDARIDDGHHSLNPAGDLRRQYDELQNKFFAVAEQNEMLEQSLIERNNLVQRWEGVLDRIDTPLQIRSMEPDGRIQWLGNALSEADHHISSLQQKVDNLENYCASIAADLEDSGRRVSELELSLQTVKCERSDLERSLVERNNLLQRWEEVLDRIDTPLPVRSMELEDRVQWLGTALSEADYQIKSLQQKSDSLEIYCGSLNAKLEESQTQVSELQFSLEAVNHEKETLSADLASLKSEHDKSLETTAQFKQAAGDLKNGMDSLNAKLEESQTQVSELQFSLEAVNHEKERLSADLASLRSEHDKSLETTAQFKQAADDLKNGMDSLQRKLAEKLATEKHILQIEGQMLIWRDLIVDALQSHGAESLISDGSSPGKCLEFLIQRLLDEYMRLRTETCESRETIDDKIPDQTSALDAERIVGPVNLNVHDCGNSIPSEPRERDTMVEEVQKAIDLRRELDDAMGELAYLKEDRDEYMKKSQSLINELEEMEKKKEEVRNQLNQEEQKSASLREKLNVAVKKGKSLVQHRDSLKQSIDGFTAEINSLKSELKMRDDSISVFQQQIEDLSSQVENGRVMESESVSLRNQLLETKQHLLGREHTLNLLLGLLDEINIDSELEVNNPVQKLEEIQKVFSNLHGAAVSSEKEMKKAKRAAELLLAELNEVQERNDNLQEDLAKAYKELSELSSQKDAAESAKRQVISRLQELSVDTQNQRVEYDLLRSYVHKMGRGFYDFSSVIADVFVKEMDLLHRLRGNLDACGEAIGSDLQLPRVSHVLMSWIADKKGYLDTYSLWGSDVGDQPDDVGAYLSKLTRDTEQLKERVCSDSSCLNEEAELLLNFIGNLKSEAVMLKRSLSSIQTKYIHLESAGKKKDAECTIMHQCISTLYDVCCRSIMDIESSAQVFGNGFSAEDIDSKLNGFLLGGEGINFNEQDLSTCTEHVKTLGNRLLLAVRDFAAMHAKSIESDHMEMKATISNLQKELQEKDVQKERVCMELVSQIKEAEATAKGYSCDLQSAEVHVHDLEKTLQQMEEERNSLQSRIIHMQQEQVVSIKLQDKVASLSSMIAAKEQEVEALMQALDEEENQMEGLKVRVEELEMDLKRKSQDLEQAVLVRSKALKKLSITVSKFDELHHMSEGLLSEVENLQTQLQDRDSEISFLRQEITRCTNDALVASKTAKERNADELEDLLKWLETTFSQAIVHDVHSGDGNDHHNIEQKDRLQKSITSVIAELEELRIVAKQKDTSLQAERNRIEELSREKQALEASLCVMESHLSSLTSAGESGQSVSEIVEAESTINKWVAPVTSTASSQVRSLRKSNNDQVAIAIDTAATETGRIEDEDDEKVHGFKSLTTSRFVPKFTRPVSDMIDGLWVSCDRTLMRQPGMRLGIMIYWAILHALLATFVV